MAKEKIIRQFCNTQNGTLNTGKSNITIDVTPLDAEMIFARLDFTLLFHCIICRKRFNNSKHEINVAQKIEPENPPFKGNPEH